MYHSDDLVSTFTNKRTAISWCVADNAKQYSLARNIQILDNKQQSLAADIHCRRSQAQRSTKSQFAETVMTKLSIKIQRYNSIQSELEKCVNSAKYLQLKGFAK